MTNIPSTPPENAAKEKVHGDSEKGNSGDNNPNSPSPDFLALIDAIAAEGRAYRKEEEREDRGKSFREWLTIAVISATFFAICRQVDEMVKVYEPIKIQAEAAKIQAEAAASQVSVAMSQAQVAITQANAAKKSAQFAASSIAISEKEFVSSHRAWIGPIDTSIVDKESNGIPVVGKPITSKTSYRNFGREPAAMTENLWIFTIPSSIYESQSFTDWMSEELSECKARLLTGVIHEAYPTGESTSYNIAISSDADFMKDKNGDKRFTMSDQIKDGSTMIISSGCITYETQGKIHHSLFCFFYKAKDVTFEHLSYCPIGQYAD